MFWLKRRRRTILSILFITPLGFYTKFYSGPAAAWVNNSLSGVFYVVFWSLGAYLLFEKASIVKLVATVVVLTGILEFAQLWQPVFLEWLRSFFLGRTILGTSFSWLDFIHYAIGCLLAWSWLKMLKKIESSAAVK